jgi:hypothetical protein
MVSQVWFNHDHNACKTYAIGQEISKVMYIWRLAPLGVMVT